MGVESLIQYELGQTPTTPCKEYRGPRSGPGYGNPRWAGKSIYLHRWVVEQIEQKPLLAGEIVLHHCDNPPCFLYEHLKRGTCWENYEDARLKGKLPLPNTKGKNHPGARLTETQVREIRSLQGRATQKEIAKEYGISQPTVSAILRKTLWGHI